MRNFFEEYIISNGFLHNVCCFTVRAGFGPDELFRFIKLYTFIAQFGGRHEDLSHPENSCRPRAKPEGDMNFLGGTNLRVSRLTGQLIVYYTESCNTTLYSAERCAVRHDRETRRLEGNTTICSPST